MGENIMANFPIVVAWTVANFKQDNLRHVAREVKFQSTRYCFTPRITYKGFVSWIAPYRYFRTLHFAADKLSVGASGETDIATPDTSISVNLSLFHATTCDKGRRPSIHTALVAEFRESSQPGNEGYFVHRLNAHELSSLLGIQQLPHGCLRGKLHRAYSSAC